MWKLLCRENNAWEFSYQHINHFQQQPQQERPCLALNSKIRQRLLLISVNFFETIGQEQSQIEKMIRCIGCLHHRWSILSQQCNEISNVYCFMAWASSGYNDIHRKTSGEPLSCLKTNIKLTAARNSIKEAECHHSAFIAPCLDYGLPCLVNLNVLTWFDLKVLNILCWCCW